MLFIINNKGVIRTQTCNNAKQYSPWVSHLAGMSWVRCLLLNECRITREVYNRSVHGYRFIILLYTNYNVGCNMLVHTHTYYLWRITYLYVLTCKWVSFSWLSWSLSRIDLKIIKVPKILPGGALSWSTNIFFSPWSFLPYQKGKIPETKHRKQPAPLTSM